MAMLCWKVAMRLMQGQCKTHLPTSSRDTNPISSQTCKACHFDAACTCASRISGRGGDAHLQKTRDVDAVDAQQLTAKRCMALFALLSQIAVTRNTMVSSLQLTRTGVCSAKQC